MKLNKYILLLLTVFSLSSNNLLLASEKKDANNNEKSSNINNNEEEDRDDVIEIIGKITGANSRFMSYAADFLRKAANVLDNCNNMMTACSIYAAPILEEHKDELNSIYKDIKSSTKKFDKRNKQLFRNFETSCKECGEAFEKLSKAFDDDSDDDRKDDDDDNDNDKKK